MTKILVIDDDDTIRMLLMRALQKQGYEIAVAKNGQEGIEQALSLRPGLIICDWMMPLVDGLEVCRLVKSNPELSTTFFILLTSRGATEDRVTGLDTGADEFLSKPIQINELNARVRAGLRIHQLNQDLRSSNRRLEAELAEAAEYVRSLLPPPLASPVRIHSTFIPSRQLGGDCFDYFWLDKENLAMYLLDVAGHGLGATLPSVSVLNLLRSKSLPSVDFTQPAQVLGALNDGFQMDSHQDKYFTMWYGVYHCQKRQLVYACGGHPPAVLISPTGVELLKTPAMPVGMFPEIEYIQESCHIQPGSTLYLFSDGAYEINLSDGTLWTLEGFADLLASCRHNKASNLDRVLEKLRQLNGNGNFEDDLSILEVNFT